jgi:PHD/YefM family antitoxin component YafN of YafNO toxin-antitoxin module
MERILTTNIVSVSDIKNDFKSFQKELNEVSVVCVLNRNKPIGYILSPERYEELLSITEDHD